MPTYAIGDIHGSSGQLDALLLAIDPTPNDTLVFLGDYVDRGPDSRGVIDRILALQSRHRVICLRGNHELMMFRSRTNKSERRMWFSVGGAQCLASYAKARGLSGSVDDVPDEHWQFLETGLVAYHETATHVFVHAGLDPAKPLDEQTEDALYWNFLTEPIQLANGKTVICGHTSQKSGAILDLGCTICIDTYAYGGGKLTALDVDTGRYWQADLFGRVTVGRRVPTV